MEIWKNIENYEGLYQISNYGAVKNIKRNVILKRGINKHGYCYVMLSKNNKSKWHSVHRLVAKAFIDNINNYKCVNHKDENRQNNFIKIWDSIIMASVNTNTNRHSIVSCCKNKLKTAGGYKWEYVR